MSDRLVRAVEAERSPGRGSLDARSGRPVAGSRPTGAPVDGARVRARAGPAARWRPSAARGRLGPGSGRALGGVEAGRSGGRDRLGRTGRLSGRRGGPPVGWRRAVLAVEARWSVGPGRLGPRSSGVGGAVDGVGWVAAGWRRAVLAVEARWGVGPGRLGAWSSGAGGVVEGAGVAPGRIDRRSRSGGCRAAAGGVGCRPGGGVVPSGASGLGRAAGARGRPARQTSSGLLARRPKSWSGGGGVAATSRP